MWVCVILPSLLLLLFVLLRTSPKWSAWMSKQWEDLQSSLKNAGKNFNNSGKKEDHEQKQ